MKTTRSFKSIPAPRASVLLWNSSGVMQPYRHNSGENGSIGAKQGKGHWSEAGQRAGLFYAILKAYKLVFDFHVNVAMKKWNSIDHKLTADDIQMEFNEISAHDAFVDGWSAATKKKCASCYLTILRQTGLLQEKTDELTPVKPDPEESAYYIHTGEEWFLEACFLYPYEINEIKSHLP